MRTLARLLPLFDSILPTLPCRIGESICTNCCPAHTLIDTCLSGKSGAAEEQRVIAEHAGKASLSPDRSQEAGCARAVHVIRIFIVPSIALPSYTIASS